ncbi:MAG: DUF6504 family protein [Firmicutes bacterium]|nr:DUF6504 family protein [Bacillota bacterium]MDH7496117.1 DUF6504 family protein [Bacillota bacterium]
MRRINRSLQVVAREDLRPERFYWRRKWLRVLSIVDEWREVGDWWRGEGERRAFTVLADNGGVYELCCDEREAWRLTKIFD